MSAPFDVVATAAGGGPWSNALGSFHLRTVGGAVRSLDVERWLSSPPPEEEELLDLAIPPALDVGCGPGRHIIALARRGLVAIGVDAGPAMVALARSRGAQAILASVFDPLPGAGWWGSALLLDGNIGIGGDPAALLGRIRSLLRPGGRALVEVSRPGEATRTELVRLVGSGEASEPFRWAAVAADRVVDLASATGFLIASLWERRGRWFARLDAT